MGKDDWMVCVRPLPLHRNPKASTVPYSSYTIAQPPKRLSVLLPNIRILLFLFFSLYIAPALQSTYKDKITRFAALPLRPIHQTIKLNERKKEPCTHNPVQILPI